MSWWWCCEVEVDGFVGRVVAELEVQSRRAGTLSSDR